VSAPLLVLDGDSLAHRAYHALPKKIKNNALVGWTNMAIRLWEMEEPRAVIVGWDTLTAPTYRHEALESYQSGREFEDSLLRQLDPCRSSPKRSASTTGRRRASRRTTSSPRR
jgi:DNA polymerase-1